MPDLVAGRRIRALDFTPSVSDFDSTSFTTTSGVFTDAGGPICGVAFVAPTTGREKISSGARLGVDSAGVGVEVTPVVREGAVVGSGADVVAASSGNAVRYLSSSGSDAGDRGGVTMLVEGLTPGASYNVQLEHRTSGGTATIVNRNVIAEPAT